MQISRKLRAQGAKESPFVHFSRILGCIESTCVSWLSEPLASPADRFAGLYQAKNLKRKAVRLHGLESLTSTELEARTYQKFCEREEKNRIINETVLFGYDRFTGGSNTDLLGEQILERARQLIEVIIGDKPNINRIFQSCSFGNGASAQLPRTRAQSSEKFLAGMSTTRGNLPASNILVGSSHVWVDVSGLSDPMVDGSPRTVYISTQGRPVPPPGFLKIVAGSVMDQVPKDAGINRIIQKEPELNGFVQKGIGVELRRLLRKPSDAHPGVCLNSSGMMNDALAREGSFTGLFATVDGREASDSITISACDFLLPPKWFELLMSARSPYTLTKDGQLHKVQMMSGMGNGFTFELESIIFYAIGLAAAEKSEVPFAHLAVSIHGDDLVVPSDCFPYVSAAYASLGVDINEEKSFSSGPFRESCGGHYYNGVSVKPFYVRKATGCTRGDWFWLYNSLDLFLSERVYKCPRLTRLLVYIGWYASSGKPEMYRVPSSYSRRSGLISAAPRLATRTCWKTRCVRFKELKTPLDEAGLYLEWLNRPKVTDISDFWAHKAHVPVYDTPVEGYEREEWVRLIAWPDPEYELTFGQLAAASVAEKRRRSAR